MSFDAEPVILQIRLMVHVDLRVIELLIAAMLLILNVIVKDPRNIEITLRKHVLIMWHISWFLNLSSAEHRCSVESHQNIT